MAELTRISGDIYSCSRWRTANGAGSLRQASPWISCSQLPNGQSENFPSKNWQAKLQAAGINGFRWAVLVDHERYRRSRTVGFDSVCCADGGVNNKPMLCDSHLCQGAICAMCMLCSKVGLGEVRAINPPCEQKITFLPPLSRRRCDYVSEGSVLPVKEEIVRSGQAQGQERTRHRWESSSSDSEVLEKKKPKPEQHDVYQSIGCIGCRGPGSCVAKGEGFDPKGPQDLASGQGCRGSVFLAHALHLKLAPARPARGSGTRGRESDVGEGGGGL
ncbi:hypothetical protein C0Q70_09658 [Pomacea canaliculata]|uniref:Uncharacterized protein n=1 Tax=Pomacea canaliculata TaxID=400727 RepID=A0A2T7PAF3_POMCA|nr:hypothetical protein C0Q70_09658 [Pomacea canaliculata]